MKTKSDELLLYGIYPSALGPFGLMWSHEGIVRVLLPEADDESVLKKITHTTLNSKISRFTGADPFGVSARIQGHFEGNLQDFRDVPLDTRGISPFFSAVYRAARLIPIGAVETYGALADKCGSSKAARAVGSAMSRNPFGLIVPCHRVIGSGGRPGGFSAYGGLKTKERLLRIEGGSLW
jgi:methylated-DNA-[protein]-cysteine S-methyltransferase